MNLRKHTQLARLMQNNGIPAYPDEYPSTDPAWYVITPDVLTYLLIEKQEELCADDRPLRAIQSMAQRTKEYFEKEGFIRKATAAPAPTAKKTPCRGCAGSGGISALLNLLSYAQSVIITPRLHKTEGLKVALRQLLETSKTLVVLARVKGTITPYVIEG